jgi:hypothetical protein
MLEIVTRQAVGESAPRMRVRGAFTVTADRQRQIDQSLFTLA